MSDSETPRAKRCVRVETTHVQIFDIDEAELAAYWFGDAPTNQEIADHVSQSLWDGDGVPGFAEEQYEHIDSYHTVDVGVRRYCEKHAGQLLDEEDFFPPDTCLHCRVEERKAALQGEAVAATREMGR